MLSVPSILALLACFLTLWGGFLLFSAFRERSRRRKNAAASSDSSPRRVHRWILGFGSLAFAIIIFSLAATGKASFNAQAATEFSIVHTVAIVAGVILGLICIYVGLRYDPARGRRRCAACWYDMHGVPSRRCPECGREWSTEKKLARTRRFWPLVLAGILLFAGSYAVYALPKVMTRGWRSLVPTTVIIVAFPWLSDEIITSDGPGVFGARYNHDTLWPWQDRLMRWRTTRVITRSTDVDSVSKAILIYNTVRDDAEQGPFVAPAVQEELVRRRLQQSRLFDEPYLPIPLAPEAADQLVPDFRAAFTSTFTGAQDVALDYVHYLGSAADPLIPDMLPILDAPYGEMKVVPPLAFLAQSSETARRAVFTLLEHPSTDVRLAVLNAIADLTGHPEEAAEIYLERAVIDPDVYVASRAGLLLIPIAEPPCQYVDIQIERMKAVPDLIGYWLDALANRCDDERLNNFILMLLREGTPEAQAEAAWVAGRLDKRGKQFLPDLQTLLDTHGVNEPRGATAAEAIQSINAAINEQSAP